MTNSKKISCIYKQYKKVIINVRFWVYKFIGRKKVTYKFIRQQIVCLVIFVCIITYFY
jgi:hypothetical protein